MMAFPVQILFLKIKENWYLLRKRERTLNTLERILWNQNVKAVIKTTLNSTSINCILS